MTIHHAHLPGRRVVALQIARSILPGVLAFVLACAGTPAQAQTQTQTQSCGPGQAGSPCAATQVAGMDSTGGVGQGAGNPVNIITGNKYQQEVDMSPLPGLLGLELVRHYNSRFAAPGMPLRGVGRGWQFSYDTRLHVAGDTVQIIQADGARIIFARSAWSRTLCTTTDPAQGLVRILHMGADRQYRWLWPNGRELSFDRKGNLIRISDPGGLALAIQRMDDGRLSSVRDPQGRTMHFHYLHRKDDKPGRYRGVQSIDTPVGRFVFDYDDTQGASPDQNGQPRARLAAVHLPTRYDPAALVPSSPLDQTPASTSVSTIKRIYHYEDSRFATLLTGITVDGAGSDGRAMRERIATWAYDQNGLAVLSVKGEPARMGADGKPVPGTGVEQIRFERATPGQTRITNSQGQRTVYRHAIVAGAFRLLEARGAGCASCGPVNLRYRYNQQGRLEEVIRLDDAGVAVEGRRQALDALGRPYAFQRVDYRQGREAGRVLVLRQQFPYPGLPYTWPDARGPRSHFGPSLVATDSLVAGKTHDVRIAYNQRHQPVSMTETGFNPVDGSEIERITRYRYADIDGRSLLVEVDGPLPNGPLGTPADSDITRHEWDERGQYLLAVTLPGDRRTVLEHDPYTGRVARLLHDDGTVTALRYHTDGQVAQVSQTRPGWDKPVVQTLLYDARGNQTGSGAGIPDLAGWRPALLSAFDNAGRPSWTAHASGQVERWLHDTEGQLVEQAQSGGGSSRSWRYRYDARGRVIGVTDPTGSVAQYRYPDGGAAHSETPPAVNRLRQVHDDFGRNVASISPDSGTTTRSYDQADRLIASTDAAGNHASYAYDLAGRILQQDIHDAGSAQPKTTRWRYEGRRLVALEHPTQDERYTYDERGLLAATTIVRRDDTGATLSSVTRYQYDGQGALTGASLPDGSMLIYQRDGQGQVTGLQRSRIQTAWLRWLLPAQRIASDIERDLTGLARYVTGNRIEARYQRSREGVLARMVYRTIDAPPATPKTETPVSTLPGALGMPPDLQALLDYRFLWDARGNLLLRQAPPGREQAGLVTGYAYDRYNRLLVAAQSQWASRYFHDANGNRLLSQQGISSQAEVQAGTMVSHYQPGTNRWLGDAVKGKTVPANRYDAVGQPETLGDRHYRWDATGRLLAIGDRNNKPIASYRYNHRGERIAREANGKSSGYLYRDGNLLAETSADGRIMRQYIWLADQPLAVIDFAAGATPAGENPWRQAAADFATAIRTWFGTPEHMRWLHANHLGAPEAATDASGHVIWRAAYEPFGAASITSAKGFRLNLRLPGQYWDEESGLHYNRHRYYDPASGRYLTPDPLGMPDGPNSYVYVKGNPLRYVDPAGLILFAFDGTNNSNPPPGVDDFSNVYKFHLAYDEIQNGRKWYMNGVGRDDPDSGIQTNALDAANANTARSRTSYMLKVLDDYMRDTSFKNGEQVNIDIVGFSRGAAMARDFANNVSERLRASRYQKSGACVQLRFMGLWDTVAQFGLNGVGNALWNMAIPDSVQHVYQAIALNEHRYLFPGEAIGRGTQRGFIGSHADIGGSYGTGDLSDVTLNWIVLQARNSGIKMKEWSEAGHKEWGIVTNPVLHDKSANGSDRDFCLRENGEAWADQCRKQKVATPGGMTWAQAQDYIGLSVPTTTDADGESKIVGSVDMKGYAKWLEQNYKLQLEFQ